MGNPLKRAIKEAQRGLGALTSVSTAGLISSNFFGGFTQKSGAAAATLAPTPVDATAGDNTAKYAADQEELARRGAAGSGGVADDGNDADLLGSSGPGAKRRAASRALLG